MFAGSHRRRRDPRHATPRGCAGAESYAFYDPASASVVERRESLVVSWYASGGALSAARSGQAEADPDGTGTQIGFTAPTTPGDVAVWAVLRDDRGGTSLREGRVRVR